LLSIYALASGKARGEIAESVKTMGSAAFKELLSQALIADLSPLQERYNKLMQNPEQIMAILQQGAARASFLAGETLQNCKQAMGFLTTLQKGE
jgi:tryptophanyl-tRNA synthetase